MWVQYRNLVNIKKAKVKLWAESKTTVTGPLSHREPSKFLGRKHFTYINEYCIAREIPSKYSFPTPF